MNDKLAAFIIEAAKLAGHVEAAANACGDDNESNEDGGFIISQVDADPLLAAAQAAAAAFGEEERKRFELFEAHLTLKAAARAALAGDAAMLRELLEARKPA